MRYRGLRAFAFSSPWRAANELDTHDKAELHLLIQRYYDGDIPLVVPITLLQHYFRKFPNDYMNQQTFLNPYPGELRLRNLL